MNTFCFITMRTALFLSQTISAIKCCSRRELICFHSKLQLFPEDSGVDGQNYVVLRVIVSNSPQIYTCPPHPSIFGDPGAVSPVGRKGATNVFKHPLESFRRTLSPNPTDCPWVSEAGIDGSILEQFCLISLIVLLEFLTCIGSTAIKILTYIRSKLDLKMARHKITKI